MQTQAWVLIQCAKGLKQLQAMWHAWRQPLRGHTGPYKVSYAQLSTQWYGVNYVNRVIECP